MIEQIKIHKNYYKVYMKVGVYLCLEFIKFYKDFLLLYRVSALHLVLMCGIYRTKD